MLPRSYTCPVCGEPLRLWQTTRQFACACPTVLDEQQVEADPVPYQLATKARLEREERARRSLNASVNQMADAFDVEQRVELARQDAARMRHYARQSIEDRLRVRRARTRIGVTGLVVGTVVAALAPAGLLTWCSGAVALAFGDLAWRGLVGE